MQEFSEKMVPGIEKKEGKEKPIIVEVGTYACPLYDRSAAIREKIKSGARYVGIDINEQNLKDLKKEGKDAIVGDLTNLPLQDDSVDEVWVINVFTDSRNRFGEPKNKDLSFNKSIKELARVIKPDGRIIIGETIYPAGELLKLDYGKFGLRSKEIRGEELLGFIKEHGMPQPGTLFYMRPDVPDFFLILTKKRGKKNERFNSKEN